MRRRAEEVTDLQMSPTTPPPSDLEGEEEGERKVQYDQERGNLTRILNSNIAAPVGLNKLRHFF